MSIIVAGRFDTAREAERAVQDLAQAGFTRSDSTTFFVNPAGQHAQQPEGGDQPADANAAKAHVGAATGAAAGSAVGAAAALAVPGIGPVLALGVVALGAYTGSLAGTLAKLGDHEAARESDASPGRHAGMLVAVRADTADAEERAIETLKRDGAADVERREGVWRNGQWEDFDPVAPPNRV